MYPSVMMTLAREAPCMDQNKGFFNDIIGIFVVVSPYMYIFKYHRRGLSRLVMIPSFVVCTPRAWNGLFLLWPSNPIQGFCFHDFASRDTKIGIAPVSTECIFCLRALISQQCRYGS